MKKDRNGNKRNRFLRFMNLLLVLGGCFVVVLLIACLIKDGIPFASNRQLGAPTSFTTEVSNQDGSNDVDVITESNDQAAWYLILVNKNTYIPDDYEFELIELSNGESVDKRIYPDLQEMFDAARNEGVYPIVASGYRTAIEQQSLLDEKIAEYSTSGYSMIEATEKAEAWVAVVGTSEHQIGIAVDINEDSLHSSSDEVYDWLNQNAYKFGFIIRYPDNKTDITGVIYEPWHYRYVGVEVATEIYYQDICLEEYLEKINQ